MVISMLLSLLSFLSLIVSTTLLKSTMTKAYYTADTYKTNPGTGVAGRILDLLVSN